MIKVKKKFIDRLKKSLTPKWFICRDKLDRLLYQTCEKGVVWYADKIKPDEIIKQMHDLVPVGVIITNLQELFLWKVWEGQPGLDQGRSLSLTFVFRLVLCCLFSGIFLGCKRHLEEHT